MAFIRKKSKPIRFPLGDENDPILIIHQIKVQKAAQILANHSAAIQAIQELATESGSEKEDKINVSKWLSDDNVTLLDDALETVVAATKGWENVVDENGNEEPYSPESLLEIIGSNIKYYFAMLQALMNASGFMGTEEDAAAKN